ncbi:MAG: major capsid protein [Nitrospinota bacterium]|nr:major capsid protein [Nitrospinota bacterium]
MPDLFEPKTMIAAIEQLPAARTFLRETFFPNEQTHDTRQIEVDVVTGGRRLAPYVSPVQEGVVMKKLGSRTDTIRLPYIKMKYDISAVEAARRAPGENPYSAKTPSERAQEILGKRLMEGMTAIARTVEVQAAQALVTGKVIALGKDGEGIDWTVEIDFGRDPALTETKIAGEYWSVDTINPFDDLRRWSMAARKTGGYNPTEVVMGSDALTAFLNNPNVQTLMDTRRFNADQVDMEAFAGQGVAYVGTAEGMNIFHYLEWYEDPSTGMLTEMVPKNAVVMGARNTRNTIHYGAIVDMEFDPRAIERKIFPKSWVQEDPSVRWLLLQSSPLATLSEPDSVYVAYPVA